MKRWKRTIISSVVFGVIAFFAVGFMVDFYILPHIEKKIRKVGYSGTYTFQTIPKDILNEASYGLTKVTKDGTIQPAAAYKWTITNEGRDYTFYIKKGQYFNDKEELNSKNLGYNFADVKEQIVDNYIVKFSLSEPYAPFLSLMSKPIFNKKLEGLAGYKIQGISLNGGFVKSVTMINKSKTGYKKIINFYPTQDALKTAFALGDIDVAYGITDQTIKDHSLSEWSGVSIKKKVNYNELLTLFFNNSDSILSDKRVREALSYSLPEKFTEGERAFSPINPSSIYFAKTPNYGISSLEIARSLLGPNSDAQKTTFEISTTEDFKNTAAVIQNSWRKLGINSKIKIVSGVPSDFQILLYAIKLPEDPDQYTLWHSKGVNNIINYRRNLRIDKLLEDGRSTNDIEQRIATYEDFQKYLIDDAPAAFIYFPYNFTLERN